MEIQKTLVSAYRAFKVIHFTLKLDQCVCVCVCVCFSVRVLSPSCAVITPCTLEFGHYPQLRLFLSYLPQYCIESTVFACDLCCFSPYTEDNGKLGVMSSQLNFFCSLLVLLLSHIPPIFIFLPLSPPPYPSSSFSSSPPSRLIFSIFFFLLICLFFCVF